MAGYGLIRRYLLGEADNVPASIPGKKGSTKAKAPIVPIMPPVDKSGYRSEQRKALSKGGSVKALEAVDTKRKKMEEILK